jgi:hypothetical protein
MADHPSIFLLLLLKKKIKYVMGHFGKKKGVKVVELQQFESLG